MREAFEEAAARLGYKLVVANPADQTGEYRDVETEDAWAMWQEACAWQAARAQGACEWAEQLDACEFHANDHEVCAEYSGQVPCARAQSGQGAEPIGYIEQDELDALRDGCFGASIRAEDDKPDCIPLYTRPQTAVPECPYPCGWDNLFKIIVENAANFARSTLDDEVPESVRQMGIDSGQYAIHLCKLVMKLSAPTGLKRPQPPAGQEGE